MFFLRISYDFEKILQRIRQDDFRNQLPDRPRFFRERIRLPETPAQVAVAEKPASGRQDGVAAGWTVHFFLFSFFTALLPCQSPHDSQ